MDDTVVCLECYSEIKISGEITEDTMIICDECGAEFIPEPPKSVKQQIRDAAVKGINKGLRKATRGLKHVKVKKR